MALVNVLNRYVEDARVRLAQAIALRNREELLCSVLDTRPGQQYETNESLFGFTKDLTITIYYRVPAIKDMVEILEFFEGKLNAEFSSWDSQETGSRGFQLTSSDFNTNVVLYASPDDDNPEATCRRVVVGEDVVTERRPRYEIVCN